MEISAKWKDTMKLGIGNPAWSVYDTAIKDEVNAYNTKFTGTPGFMALNWKLVKAMLWTESGGPTNAAWTTRPMQIGNPNDPAYGVLKAGSEGSSEIMDAATWAAIKTDINKPTINIKAGIAYLYTRLAKTEIKSVPDKINTRVYSHTVVQGDSLSKIATTEGTTVDELNSQNKPEVLKVLRPKQVVMFRKASMKRVIVGWRSFTAAEIAQRYNVGDQAYAQKLTYLIDTIFPQLEKPPTTPAPKAAAAAPKK